MKYWLLKTEPATYSVDDLQRDKSTAWTGVRNFQARNNLKAMNVGDVCLVYHTGDQKAVVGLAKVVKEAYADPTAKEGDWVAVDIAFATILSKPVLLAAVKKDVRLKNMQLVTHSRLSVQVVLEAEYDTIINSVSHS